jgi:hypothetical protein
MAVWADEVRARTGARPAAERYGANNGQYG